MLVFNVVVAFVFEFSLNFTLENIENLKSVKSTAKSNFKMYLVGDT